MNNDGLNDWNWVELEGKRLELHCRSGKILNGVHTGLTAAIMHLSDVEINVPGEGPLKVNSVLVHESSIEFCIPLDSDFQEDSIIGGNEDVE